MRGGAFRRLKRELFERDITQQVLAAHLRKSQAYISSRITGKKPWDMNDMYDICDLLSVPYNELHELFPKNGGRVK